MSKRLDFTQDTFVANGTEYQIQKELTISRFKVLEELEVEFFYGFTMQEMFDKLKESFMLLDKSKMAQASVKVHNLMTGIADRVDKRQPVMLRICSLFVNTKGEDPNEWSDELAEKKISDWSKEGYAMADFFSLAAVVVPGFTTAYEEILANTFLQKQEKEPKSQSDKPSSKPTSDG